MSAGPADPSAPAKRKRSGVVVPHPPRWFQRLAAWAIWAVIQSVAATLRRRLEDSSGFFHPGQPPRPIIYCVWHNRLALCLVTYYGYGQSRNPTAGLAAMCSASKDGAFLAAILERFKVQPVRGSSSRRGPQALLELTTWAQRGYDLAITPDGPRGPCYKIQPGIISLAQVTGLPILPVSYDLSFKIRVKSWDRFQIPLPFSRWVVRVAPPITVPREADDAAREQARLQLERSLRQLTGE